MKKSTSLLSALALSATLLSSCGNASETGSGDGRAADNANLSTQPSATSSDMNGSVGNGGTSTNPEDAAGKRSDANSSTPGDVGADASGTSSSTVSGAGTTSDTGTTPPDGKGSTTTNVEGLGGAGKGKAGSNPGTN